MTYYKTLFHISKTLQFQAKRENLPRLLLDQVLEALRADKGFIVVKEEGSFQEKYHIHYDRDRITARQRKFSRSLVREAISSQEVILSEDITEDPRFMGNESVMNLGRCSAMVIPLSFEGDVEAVIYLEKKSSSTPFSEEDQKFMSEFSELAGVTIHRAVELDTLARLRKIHERENLSQYNFEGIIGRHPKMNHLLETVAQVADSDAPVLVNGETGTGKELIARAVFLNSERKKKPFITLHCGALPETLFESELFGHRKGAFTGAHADRQGRIAQAQGGTLFLDEVAEIPLSTQAKLLRFIQFGEFQRVGSDHVETVDIRIVAATHKNLSQMVEDGMFRQDLYFRLNVLELEIPPLRDRRSDIPLLMDYFLKKYWRKKNETPQLAPSTVAVLENYNFPGNIRELAHVVERMCVMARSPVLEAELLPRNIQESYRQNEPQPIKPEIAEDLRFESYSNDELKAARDRASKKAIGQVERKYLTGLLELCDGNITRAAEVAGMQRPYLHRLIAKYKD